MRNRRRYTLGQCADCGRTRRTTVIIFWVSGMRYRVCADCIKAYRAAILKPCAPHCDRCASDAREAGA